MTNWSRDTSRAEAWLGSDAEVRAYDTERMIADSTVSIPLIRDGATLAAQPFRLDNYRGAALVAGANETVTSRRALLLGYRNHPTIANSDVQRGDRFFLNGAMYEVVDIDLDSAPDQIQAILEVRP